MKHANVLKTIILSSLIALTSCNGDSGGSAEIEEVKNHLNLNEDYTRLFPNNAVNEGVSIVNQLIDFNDKVNRTALYDGDLEKFYEKNIKTSLGEISLKGWTANGNDLFKKQNQLANKVRNKFNQGLQELITLRKKITQHAQDATPGKYGQIGSYTTGDFRYVDALGIETSEIVEKQIMGIILLDQILNEHLGDQIMKDTRLKQENTQKIKMQGLQITQLQYHWDIAYALIGLENREAQPKFIANYLIKEFQGAEFMKGADKRVFEAFKKGRKALQTADYDTVDQQIQVIRETLSKLYATRCVHYLKQAKVSLLQPREQGEYAKAFHPLSEACGFIYAFIATRRADGTFYIHDYQTIEEMANKLIGDNGFWGQDRLLGSEEKRGALEAISQQIGEIFGFRPEQIN